MPGSTEIPNMAEEAREEDVDYESDPEDVKLSLKMRRREASDDEEDEDGGDAVNAVAKDAAAAMPRRRVVDSDVESDGQGAVADYEDEYEDEEYEEDEEYVEELEDGYVERRVEIVGAVAVKEEQVEELVAVTVKEGFEDGAEPVEESEHQDGEADGEGEGEEAKKENEPFAVPTAGAFYMHDDRFRDSAGGRNRRTFGGRKLWESKDEKKWGHDKFEELTQQDRHFDEGRASRGRNRGRGRGRGPVPERGGLARGNKPRPYNSNNNQNRNNPSNVPKNLRGRGPRKYQPSFRNSDDVPLTQNQQSGRTADKLSHSGSGRVSASSSNNSEAAPTSKHAFASSLNSASPPFYPSTSASKEIPLAQKRDVSGTNNRRIPSVVGPSFSTAPPSALQRGKVAVDSIGMDKLHIDDSVAAVPGKPSTNLQFHSGSSSMGRAQGRGINSSPQMAYQPTGSANQGNRITPPTQLHAAKRNPVQGRGHPSQHGSGQQFALNSSSGSQVSSPPKASLNKSSFESGEKETTSEMSKSKAALVVKGKGSGRGSFLYGGAQVMGASGNLGSAHGDPNFPAFLPLMQFGGQHPAGMGVPAVGMAFPGYVAQPQLGGGIGNSEMTWLPVLAGAAGAMGATYPFMSMDGSYNIRPPGQASSTVPAAIKENNADKPSNEWNSSQRPEMANDDFGQRQKIPRRYTEMKFDQ